MSQNENQIDQLKMLQSQKQTIEEVDVRQTIEQITSLQQSDRHSTLGDQELNNLNETTQQQNTSSAENDQQQLTINSKSQIIDSLSAGGITQRPQTMQLELRQQPQQIEMTRTLAQDSGIKRIHSSRQQKNETHNDSFISQSAKKIKTHLLFNQIEKPKIMQSFPFSQVGMFPHNQQNQLNFFFYDNQVIENTKLQNTQRDRKQMQEYLQNLQNRVHLLEKEDKKSQNEFRNIQKQANKHLQAMRMNEERKQLNEYVRMQRANDQQQKLLENNFMKNQQREILQLRKNESQQSLRSKADSVKNQLNKLKVQQVLQSDQLAMSNIHSFNTIKYSQKQAQIRRITHSDDKRKFGSSQYNDKIMVEETLNALKQMEYAELEEKEKQLLERLQRTQTMFNNAVEDMQKVINIPVKNTSQASLNEDIMHIKRNIMNQNSITPQAQQQATQMADNFINQVNLNKNNYSTYKFKIPIENNNNNNDSAQFQKFTISGSQSTINAAIAAASQGSPLRTLSTQQPYTNRSDQEQGFEEEQDVNKLKSNKLYSNHSQRRIRMVKPQQQQSMQSSSIADSHDLLASTTSSAKFKLINNLPFETQLNSVRNNANMQLNSPQSSKWSQRKIHINVQQNLSMGNIRSNLNIGQPFTPHLANKKMIRQSAK